MTDFSAYALDFLARATNGAKGVARGDAPYERITEGRHPQAVKSKLFYSACGDLAQALLFAAGIRDRRFINRAENGTASGDPYKVGWNVVELDALARAMRDYKARPVMPEDLDTLRPGDVTIVWNKADTTDAHVAVVRVPLAPVGLEYVLGTSDYGQGSPFDGKPCLRGVRGTVIGGRKLQRIIPLAAALERFRVAEPIPLDEYFGAGEPAARPTLRKGDKGDSVRDMQSLLNVWRAPRAMTLLRVDGDFGPITETALKAFQTARGLVVDGVCGPLSWATLED